MAISDSGFPPTYRDALTSTTSWLCQALGGRLVETLHRGSAEIDILVCRCQSARLSPLRALFFPHHPVFFFFVFSFPFQSVVPCSPDSLSLSPSLSLSLSLSKLPINCATHNSLQAASLSRACFSSGYLRAKRQKRRGELGGICASHAQSDPCLSVSSRGKLESFECLHAAVRFPSAHTHQRGSSSSQVQRSPVSTTDGND